MILVVPHLILRKDNKFLLTRRSSNKKIWPNHWHCVTGTIEEGESPKQAIIREAEEEVGLKLADVSLVTTIFLVEKSILKPGEKYYGVELFFLADLLDHQVPVNMEPTKQDAMDWFDIKNLPQPIIPGVKFGLISFINNLNYAELDNTWVA